MSTYRGIQAAHYLCLQIRLGVILLACFSVTPSVASSRVSNDVLVGITWDSSKLVSFNPYIGKILKEFGQLNTHEAFTGLTYDRNRRKLYAPSQVQNKPILYRYSYSACYTNRNVEY
jgi:hypothetical protein